MNSIITRNQAVVNFVDLCETSLGKVITKENAPYLIVVAVAIGCKLVAMVSHDVMEHDYAFETHCGTFNLTLKRNSI